MWHVFLSNSKGWEIETHRDLGTAAKLMETHKEAGHLAFMIHEMEEAA